MKKVPVEKRHSNSIYSQDSSSYSIFLISLFLFPSNSNFFTICPCIATYLARICVFAKIIKKLEIVWTEVLLKVCVGIWFWCVFPKVAPPPSPQHTHNRLLQQVTPVSLILTRFSLPNIYFTIFWPIPCGQGGQGVVKWSYVISLRTILSYFSLRSQKALNFESL